MVLIETTGQVRHSYRAHVNIIDLEHFGGTCSGTVEVGE